MKGKSFKPGARISPQHPFTKLIALQYPHRSFEAIQNPIQRDGCVEVDNFREEII